MNNGFRQSMTWLHTWTGLVLGWVLYFMFVTGTVGYLDTEIDRWMKPEAPMPVVEMNTTTAIQAGLDHLKTAAPDATHWFISLPRDRNNPYLFTFWREADGNSGRNYLDPTSGQPFETRDSGGGQVLYRMHWQLHYLPDSFTGWFISIATIFMFVALITGIIAHKNIFKDFFTFRPRKGQRSWLDAHNVLSVLTLPFQLMITYSGLIFMMFICMPLIITAFYGSGEADRDRFFDEVFASVAEFEAADKPASLVDIAGPIATAEARWGADGIHYVDIDHPGDANARITLGGTISRSPLRSSPQLIFDGVTGELLTTVPARGSAAKATRDVFLGLHEGLFAGPALRTLYVLSGFLGAAMIATGLVLWAVKRRKKLEQQRPASARGLALVERLNVGTIVGLPTAIAAYFWANRLLPLDMTNRAEWEVHAMFIVWVLMLGHAALRPVRRAWLEQFRIAAGAFLLLPVLNALTTDRHLAHSLPTGDWVFAGFDLTVLGIGLILAWTAGRIAVSTNPLAKPTYTTFHATRTLR